MKAKSPAATRITTTEEVRKALSIARKRYSTLSDAEIFKVALAKIAREESYASHTREEQGIMAMAAQSVGYDYLSDPEEDIYHKEMGTKVNPR